GPAAHASACHVAHAPADAPVTVRLAATLFGLLGAAADLDRDVAEAEEEDARVALRERAVECEARAEDIAPEAARRFHIGREHDGVVHALDEGAAGHERWRRLQAGGQRPMLDEEDARAVRRLRRDARISPLTPD